MDYDKEAVKRKLTELQNLLGPSDGDAMLEVEPSTDKQDGAVEKPALKADDKSNELAPPRDLGDVVANENKPDMSVLEMIADDAPKGREPVGLREKAAHAAKHKMSSMKK